MNLIEFIGFIITLAAMTAILFKKKLEDRERRKNPEKFSENEALRRENLKQMLKSLNLDIEEEEEEEVQYRPPPPLPPKNTPSNFKREIPAVQKKTTVEQKNDPYRSSHFVGSAYTQPEHDAYAIVSRHTVSKGQSEIQSLKSKKEMIVLHEILSRPKSERL